MTADDFTPAEQFQADEYEAIRFEDEPRRNLILAILAAGFAVAVVAGVWAASPAIRNFIAS